jgi:aldehyde:ferredoxin oxidoreductase
LKFKGGYVGKIARINLSTKRVKTAEVDPYFAVKYTGGRGWCAKIIWDETPEYVDPLEFQNKLVVATGPLTGLLVPSSGKTTFAAISPETGYYGDSNIGGMFGSELKQAGFDAIIIEEAAREPVYIHVEDGKIRVRGAKEYWGLGSFEAEEALKKEHGKDSKVASIGPAGEKQVKFACINCDYGRQAGRCGLGAVMGSKKVKAIVVRGTLDIPVADIDELTRIFSETFSKLVNHKDFKIWQKQGTMQIVDWANDNCCLPTRNFQAATYENFAKIDGAIMEKTSKIISRAGSYCPISCRQFNEIRSGKHKGVRVDGPEFETAALLGSNCALPNIEDLMYANYLCDNLGVDTISAGNVIAFITECYEKGLITEKDTGGLKLEFGNSEAVFRLIEMIAKREGIGNLLAEGVKKTAEKVGKGSEKFAMQVKGLEISGYDHRAAQAMALAYATCDIGAHHNRAWAITYDIKVGRTAYTQDKAEWVIYLQHVRPLFDNLGVCRFPWVELNLDLNYYARFYTAATGIKTELGELLRASERIYNLTRAISIRNGLTGDEDWLPDRDFETPLPTGTVKGQLLDRGKFKELVQLYYKLRGWGENGVPTKKKLKELGLDDVAEKI